MGMFEQPIPTPEQMATMSWNDLIQLRNKYANRADMQELIAPFEHRAYAREQASVSPMSGLAFGGLLVPGYQIAKATGMLPVTKMTTKPSLEQIKAGMLGSYEGIRNYLRR